MNILTRLRYPSLRLFGAVTLVAALVVVLTLNHSTTHALVETSCEPSGLYGSAKSGPSGSGGGVFMEGGNSSLYSINPTDGTAISIGEIGFDNVGSLDFHPDTNAIYGWDGFPLTANRALAPYPHLPASRCYFPSTPARATAMKLALCFWETT